jgi:glycosyltransferase involved in cell wall biosynthesis
MDIIVTYCEFWDTSLRTSKHHYLERLAADGHRILYVEMPANPFSIARRFDEFIDKVFPRIRVGVEEVSSNIWVMNGFVPLPYRSGFGGVFDHLLFNQINQSLMLPRLKAAQIKLGFRTPLLLSYYPLAYPIIKDLGVEKVIFHIVDEWQGMPGIPRSMARLTQAMLETADLTIVTSGRLFERYRYFAKNIKLLRHGTDISLFGGVAQGVISPDLQTLSLPGKKIGYYGALHKLDINLIISIAKARPNWSFVFIGPLSGGQGVAVKKVFPDNVTFLDEKPRSSLPSYLAALDAFWMPFMVNELTQSMCPIKIYEVLSAGLPLVSSDLEECRAVAGYHCLFAQSTYDHLTQLERAMSLRTSDEMLLRAESMRNYDWSSRYKEFLQMLQL